LFKPFSVDFNQSFELFAIEEFKEQSLLFASAASAPELAMLRGLGLLHGLARD